jgi:hypothetical protein
MHDRDAQHATGHDHPSDLINHSGVVLHVVQ